MDPNLQCSVPGCQTRANQSLRFYQFPFFNLELCSIWESRVRGTSNIEIDSRKAQICELHFDYRCKTGKDSALEENSLPSIHLPEFNGQFSELTHFHTSAEDITEPDFEISADVISSHCRFCFSKGLLYQIQTSTYKNKSFLSLIDFPLNIVHESQPPNACLSCLKCVVVANWLSRAVQHSNTILELLQHPAHSKLVINRYDNSLDIKSELSSCNLIPADYISIKSDIVIKAEPSENVCGASNMEVVIPSAILFPNGLKLEVEKPSECDDESGPSIMVVEHDYNAKLINSDESENSLATVEDLSNVARVPTRENKHKCREGYCSASRRSLARRNSRVQAAADFVCIICDQFNASATGLTAHYSTEHQLFQCEICLQVWGAQQKTPRSVKTLKCKHCSFRTYYNASLQRHLLLHQEDAKLFLCTHCGQGFLQKHGLEIHSIQHADLEVPIKCGLCTKEFKTKHEHRLHKNINCGLDIVPTASDDTYWCEESGLFVCPKCDWKHPSHNKFMDHLGKHGVKSTRLMNSANGSEERETIYTIPERNKYGRLKCSECPLSFRFMNKLKYHMRSHTGERPYKCTLCTSAFRHTSHLKRHMHSRHSDLKPFPCKICDKSYKSMAALYSHEHIVHSGGGYKCTYCDKTFNTLFARNNHRRVVHNTKQSLPPWYNSL